MAAICFFLPENNNMKVLLCLAVVATIMHGDSSHCEIGTLCQVIFITSSQVISPCVTKARAGIDTFSGSAKVSGLFPQLLAVQWDPFIYLEITRPNARPPNMVCSIHVNISLCQAMPPNVCTCVYSPGALIITVNMILSLHDSQQTLMFRWNGPGGIVQLSDKNITLPEVCDFTTALLTLTIAGTVVSLPGSSFCAFSMDLDTSHDMTLCCSNMATPCYVQISIGNTVVASNESPCVTYTPTAPIPRALITLSYSVCAKTFYNVGGTCVLLHDNVTTRATTQAQQTGVTPANRSHPTCESSTYAKCDVVMIVLWIALIVTVAVILSATAYWIILRRKKAAVPEPTPDSFLPDSIPQPDEPVEEGNARKMSSYLPWS